MRDQVQLYVCVRLVDGTHPYLRAAYARNGRVRPSFGMQNGRAVEFPGCTYHLRDREGTKRKWESAGTDSSLTLVKIAEREAAIERPVLATRIAPTLKPAMCPQWIPRRTRPKPQNQKLRRARGRLTECAARYVTDVATHKSESSDDLCRSSHRHRTKRPYTFFMTRT